MVAIAPERRTDEHALVARAIERDAEAFAALYERHALTVYRRLMRLTGNALEAEELASQTFLQAWQAIDRYELRGAPFVSWLLRIAHNLGVTYLRSKRDNVQLPEEVVDGRSLRNPQEAAVQRQEVDRLRDAMLDLRAIYRHVLLLRFFEELAYPEVAQRVGKSVPAVRLIQHRALHALRRQMVEPEGVLGDVS